MICLQKGTPSCDEGPVTHRNKTSATIQLQNTYFKTTDFLGNIVKEKKTPL